MARAATDYASIFTDRGQRYEGAMAEYPQARAIELRTMARALDCRAGMRVLDAHAGGAYLRPFLPPALHYVAVEESLPFQQAAQARLLAGDVALLSADQDTLPVAAASCDRIASLAGLHHVADRAPIYSDFFRALAPGGLLVIADVAAGSPQDSFLNGFVDAHNSMGHRGYFLDHRDPQWLRAAGFTLLDDRMEYYPWRFSNAAAASTFCSELFGLDDPAGTAQLAEALGGMLGAGPVSDGWQIPWSLRYLIARAPEMADR